MLPKLILLMVGIVFGWLGCSIFFLQRKKLALELAHQIIQNVEKKREEIERKIQESFLQEKTALEIHWQSLYPLLEEKRRQLQDGIQIQERDIESWEKKIQKAEEKAHISEKELKKNQEESKKIAERIKILKQQIIHKLLEHIQGDIQEIKAFLLKNLEQNVSQEIEISTANSLESLSQSIEYRGKQILSTAIQRSFAFYRIEPVSTFLTKGNVKEWKKLLEQEELTKFIHDNLEIEILYGPGEDSSILLYSADGYKREIARRVLEKIWDTQAKTLPLFEEILTVCQKEMEEEVRLMGENVGNLLEVSLHPKLYQLLGRLKYRTSFGQNVLSHCVEVAYIAKLLAMEVGLNSHLACCAGLLHDIGKAVDQEKEGGHAEIGGELLRQFYTEPEILDGVAKHHEDTQGHPYAMVISIADAISASRPGARRETFEIYIKRLDSLETIASKMPGVENAFAISAGRELRVIVNPTQISDEEAGQIAKQIAKKIEEDLHYPGTIKIVVIRETKVEECTKSSIKTSSKK